jgi:hypothetical protein
MCTDVAFAIDVAASGKNKLISSCGGSYWKLNDLDLGMVDDT